MLLRARWVVPVSADAIEDGAVVVRSGRIRDVGPFRLVAGRHPEEPARDLGDAALLPGFVNAHSHLELTLLRGFLDDLPFFPWLRRLVEVKADTLKRQEYVFYSLLGAAEMIRAGVTCVADCTDSGAPFDALAVSGLRGIVFQEAFAPTRDAVPAAMAGLAERLDALQAMSTPRLRAGLSPHSPLMACPEMLEASALMASERGLPISIHLAESRAEVDLLRDASGPMAEHRRSRGWGAEPYGRTPVEHVAAAGWLDLDVNVQLVHLVHAGSGDLERIAAARRAPGVAACPRSNAKLGNGLPDLGAFTRAGLAWGLGTDGAPSAGRCDPFAEMGFAYLAARAVAADPAAASAREILSRATLEAARSLGLGDSIGSLEVGKEADLAAVSLSGAAATPAYDPCSAIVQTATPGDVVLTMVAGEVLWDGRQLVTLDEERVLARCRERAAFLAAATTGRKPSR